MTASPERKMKRSLEEAQKAGIDLSTYAMNGILEAEPQQLEKYRSYFAYQTYAEALTRVKWIGLPDSISARYLEKSLYLYGSATITNIDSEYMAQIATLYNLWDKQENFKDFMAQSAQGTMELKNIDNSVLIYDNLMRESPKNLLDPLIEDASQAMTTASSNLIQQRYGVFIESSKNNQEDAKKLARSLGIGNVGTVTIKNQMDNIGIRTIKPDVEDKSEIAFSAKKEFVNEIHSFLGTDYIVHEKKERLVSGETNAQLDKINRQRDFFLEPRKLACKQMNKKFGWDTDVIWNASEQTDAERSD